MILKARVGSRWLLAREGDRRLCLLDAPAQVLWDLHAAGFDAGSLADLLVERFGLAVDTARAQVDGLIAQWADAGLLEQDSGSAENWRLGGRQDPVLPVPFRSQLPRGEWILAVADSIVCLSIDEPVLAHGLEPLLLKLRVDSSETVASYRLHLQGNLAGWRLRAGEMLLSEGTGVDAAMVATLNLLTELGSRPAERLMVVHGAGLVSPRGAGLLLIAPGGSGKTTLAAALNAEGYALLSDDVVPVMPSGHMLGTNLPLCLKAGSWLVLSDRRPELVECTVTDRDGASVRYLPPVGAPVGAPVTPALVLFPRYDPAAAPEVARLGPEAVLEGLVVAESVLRDLTQQKLQALVHWVGSTPAFRLTYPDLDAGLVQVRKLVDSLPGGVSR